MHRKRRDSLRPENPAIIMVHLDNRPHQAPQPYSVATHHDFLLFPFLIAIRKMKRIRKFRLQRENVSHFNRALTFKGLQRFTAFRTAGLLANYLSIDRDAAFWTDVNNILTGRSKRLKFVGVF